MNGMRSGVSVYHEENVLRCGCTNVQWCYVVNLEMVV